MKVSILFLLAIANILANVAAEENRNRVDRLLRRKEDPEQESSIKEEKAQERFELSAEEKKILDSEVFDRFLASDRFSFPAQKPIPTKPTVPKPIILKPPAPARRPTPPKPVRRPTPKPVRRPTRKPTRRDTPRAPSPSATLILPPIPETSDEVTYSDVAEDATTGALSTTKVQKEKEKKVAPSTNPAPITSS